MSSAHLIRAKWATSLYVCSVILGIACKGSEQFHAAVVPLDHRCAPLLDQRMIEWQATGEVFRSPPNAEFVERYRITTGELGVWILLDLHASGTASLSRVTPEGARRVSVDLECRQTVSFEPIETVRDGDVFTDADLEVHLAERPPGIVGTVVYVWSPHMPLSLDGYHEIKTAASESRLQLIPVLFAGSDREYATREAMRAGIPQQGLREIAAIELIFRDAHVHAPTIVLFGERRVSQVLPGYRNAAGYRRFIEDFLTGQRAADLGN